MRIENDSNGEHWAAGPWWPLKVLCMLLLMAAFLWRALSGDWVVRAPLGLALVGGVVNLWHYRLLREGGPVACGSLSGGTRRLAELFCTNATRTVLSAGAACAQARSLSGCDQIIP